MQLKKKKISLKKLAPVRESICGLNTVCEQARCPNISDCYGRGHLTLLIGGKRCTRKCLFCSVAGGEPEKLDPCEPARVADAAKRLKIKHAVVTSPTRDDLEDGGAGHFISTVHALKKSVPGIKVELLIPDFMLNLRALETVALSGADIVGHNMETVKELYGIRPRADYYRSLKVLKLLKKFNPTLKTKTGFMLGLGEKREEVKNLMEDILDTGCRLLSIGQYLQPSKDSISVSRYLSEDEFGLYRDIGLDMGFEHIRSGTYVRSSYRAGEYLENKDEKL